MKPNFTGSWKLIRREINFGFFAPPRLKNVNGDVTVGRNLTIGGQPAEIAIVGRGMSAGNSGR